MRILESMEWEEVACLDLSSSSIRASKDAVSMPSYGTLVAWREPLNWLEENRARGIVGLNRPVYPSRFPHPSRTSPGAGRSKASHGWPGARKATC